MKPESIRSGSALYLLLTVLFSISLSGCTRLATRVAHGKKQPDPQLTTTGSGTAVRSDWVRVGNPKAVTEPEPPAVRPQKGIVVEKFVYVLYKEAEAYADSLGRSFLGPISAGDTVYTYRTPPPSKDYRKVIYRGFSVFLRDPTLMMLRKNEVSLMQWPPAYRPLSEFVTYEMKQKAAEDSLVVWGSITTPEQVYSKWQNKKGEIAVYQYETLAPVEVYAFENGRYVRLADIEKGERFNTIGRRIELETRRIQPVEYNGFWLHISDPHVYILKELVAKVAEIRFSVNKTTSAYPRRQPAVSSTSGGYLPGMTPSTGATIHTGPRGGRYYYNSKGNKTYIRKK